MSGDKTEGQGEYLDGVLCYRTTNDKHETMFQVRSDRGHKEYLKRVEKGCLVRAGRKTVSSAGEMEKYPV